MPYASSEKRCKLYIHCFSCQLTRRVQIHRLIQLSGLKPAAYGLLLVDQGGKTLDRNGLTLYDDHPVILLLKKKKP